MQGGHCLAGYHDVMSKWVYAGSCIRLARAAPDQETISLLGVNPWRHPWKSQREGVPVVLRNPESPSGEIWAKVYKIEPEGRDLTFAVGSFPDGRWCFFLPADAKDAPGGRAREPKFEGHWRDHEDGDPGLPWPAATPDWSGRAAFLTAFDLLEAESERVSIGVRLGAACVDLPTETRRFAPGAASGPRDSGITSLRTTCSQHPASKPSSEVMTEPRPNPVSPAWIRSRTERFSSCPFRQSNTRSTCARRACRTSFVCWR